MKTRNRSGNSLLARLIGVPYVAIAAAIMLAFSMLPVAASAATLPTGAARLRIIDLAAFATPTQGIRLYVDGALQATTLGFGSSSAYSTVFAGRHHIQIFATATGKPVLDVNLRLLAGNDYSYLIEGHLRGTVYPVLATDDNTAVMAGQARVRFANAVPDSAAVTARLVGSAASFHTTAFTGLSPYQTVPAGTYALDVMSASGQKLMTVPNVRLASGGIYTLFATALNSVATTTSMAQPGTVVVDSATGSQIASAPTVAPAPAPTTASLRLVDLVPTAQIAQPLTLAIDGQPFFGSIGYGSATTFLSIQAGNHHVQVYRTTGGAPVLDTTLSLAAHTSYSYVLSGMGANAVSGKLIGADTSAVAGTVARVRFSNMVPNGQPIRASLIGAVSFDTTAPGSYTGYVLAPAGHYVLQLYSQNGAVIATIPNVTLNGGQTYTLFATDLSGKPGTAPLLAISATGGQFIAPVTLPAPQAKPGVPAAPAPVAAPPATSATMAQLRMANLVRGLTGQNATFYLDGSPFTAPLGFGNSTVFAGLTPGQHRIEVFGANGHLAINTTVRLEAGKMYTFAAEGIQGGTIEGALLAVMPKVASATEAQVRVANAVPGYNAVLASFVNVNISFGTAPFAGAGKYQAVPAGTYTLMVRTVAGRVILTVPNITIQAGKAYTIFVTNPTGGTATAGTAAIVLSA